MEGPTIWPFVVRIINQRGRTLGQGVVLDHDLVISPAIPEKTDRLTIVPLGVSDHEGYKVRISIPITNTPGGTRLLAIRITQSFDGFSVAALLPDISLDPVKASTIWLAADGSFTPVEGVSGYDTERKEFVFKTEAMVPNELRSSTFPAGAPVIIDGLLAGILLRSLNRSFKEQEFAIFGVSSLSELKGYFASLLTNKQTPIAQQPVSSWKDQEEPPDLKRIGDYREPTSERLSSALRYAAGLATAAGRVEIDAGLLFAGLIFPLSTRNTAFDLHAHLRSLLPEGQHLWDALGFGGRYGIAAPEERSEIREDIVFGVSALTVLNEAGVLRNRTTGLGAPIHTRHVVTAILSLNQHPELRELWQALRRIGVTPRTYRDWMSGLAAQVREPDDPDEWVRIFREVPLEATVAPARFFTQPPREVFYVNDRALAKTQDALGRDGVMRSFAALLAWKDLKPPLALGIFGPWGSGKSFFMEKLQAYIDELQSQARKNPESQSCRRIVHIDFNAWHYNEANLWAGLVTRIFEGLREAFDDKAQPKANSFEALRSELESAKEQLRAVELRKEVLNSQAKTAQSRLDDISRKQEEKRNSLRELATQDFWKKALANEEVKKLVDGHLTRLGFDPAVSQYGATMAAFTEVQAELKTFRGAFDTLRRNLGWNKGEGEKRPHIGRGVIIVGACVGLTVAISCITPTWTEGFAKYLTGALAFAGTAGVQIKTALVYVRKLAEKGNDILGFVERYSGELRSNETAAVEQELQGLLHQTQEAEAELNRAWEAVAEIEREMEDIKSGRRLYSFIAERMDMYKNYLSIVSLIRKDFETLSDKLREWRAVKDEAGEQYPIDRIILYIDDLDRCQAGKVVDVLQAVHLLLAFDLFVVVVGVDPLWVINSLYQPYRAFVSEDEKGKLWPSALNPVDYLDKIFQIPYSFPRRHGGLETFMRSLTEQRGTAPAEEAQGTGNLPLPGVRGAADTVGDDPAQRQDSGEAGNKKETHVEPATHLKEPKSYELKSWEARLLVTTSEFLASPRTAKRFFNLYLILRDWGVDAGDFEAFVGDGEPSERCRALVLLLGIVTGFPALAPDVIRALERQGNDATWESLQAELQAAFTETGGPEQGQREEDAFGIAPLSDEQQWRELKDLLSSFENRPGVKLLQDWVQGVRPFSVLPL